jgi:hypothetical protein
MVALLKKAKAARVSPSRFSFNPVAADWNSVGDRKKVNVMNTNIHPRHGADNPCQEKISTRVVNSTILRALVGGAL